MLFLPTRIFSFSSPTPCFTQIIIGIIAAIIKRWASTECLQCFRELRGGCVPALWTPSCAEAAVGDSLASETEIGLINSHPWETVFNSCFYFSCTAKRNAFLALLLSEEAGFYLQKKKCVLYNRAIICWVFAMYWVLSVSYIEFTTAPGGGSVVFLLVWGDSWGSVRWNLRAGRLWALGFAPLALSLQSADTLVRP